MRQRRRANRSQDGVTTIAEFGPTLFLCFIFFVMPFMAMGLLFGRYMFIVNATRTAAEAGAQARTYLADITTTLPGPPPTTIKYRSSVNTVQDVMTAAKLAANGVTCTVPTDVTTSIVFLPYPTYGQQPDYSNVQVFSQAAGNAPITAVIANGGVYKCQVTTKASINALAAGGQYYFKIPGLTENIPIQCSVTCDYESTQGLKQ